ENGESLASGEAAIQRRAARISWPPRRKRRLRPRERAGNAFRAADPASVAVALREVLLEALEGLVRPAREHVDAPGHRRALPRLDLRDRGHDVDAGAPVADVGAGLDGVIQRVRERLLPVLARPGGQRNAERRVRVDEAGAP